MKKMIILFTGLFLLSFTGTLSAETRIRDQVRYYDISVSAPFEIRRSSLDVNLFMYELKDLFLEGYFSGKSCVFEDEGLHERQVDLRISRFEDHRKTFIVITYTWPDADGLASKTADRMLEYRFISVYGGSSNRRREPSTGDESILDTVKDLIKDQVDEVSVEREFYARNAELCAEDIIRTLERMEKGVD